MTSFTMADLFAGIGGIRLGFESVGGHCVFTAEKDTFCLKTYAANFSTDHPLVTDITQVQPADIPDHDVLLAGFPCQPFSIAGVSKKKSLGRPHGFECKTQGTLFFNVAQVIAQKKPRAFMLENVKNLLGHDKKRTFRIILDVLQTELGYDTHWRVMDAKHFLPQHRERIIIAGFRERCDFSLETLPLPTPSHCLGDILEKESSVPDKYVLSEKLWDYLQRYAAKHRALGNGFGYGLVRPDQTTRTLSARYFRDGSEILVWRGDHLRPRRLMPRECARLMGFPDSFQIPVSDTQAYRQFGNSVAVPLIAAVANHMRPFLSAAG